MPKSFRDWKKRARDLERQVAVLRRQAGLPEGENPPASEDIENIKKRVAELENEKLYDRAEFENYQRRMRKERSDLLRYSGQNVLTDLLDVEDNFERALEHAKQSDKDTLIAGVKMIKKSLEKIFDANEVKEIDCLDKPFDTANAEAIQVVEDKEKAPGTVLAIVQKGYTYKDKILRPAKVVVVKEEGK